MDKNQGRNGMNRRTFVKTALAGAAGLTLSSWGVPTLLKASVEPLKLGCIYPLTGGMVGYGLPAKAAMEYACEKMNAKGGIMGRKLVPIFRDEQMNPEATVRALKDLVLNEGCQQVGGCLSSNDGLAASLAVRDMKGKALWATYTAATILITEEKGHRYQIRPQRNTVAYARASASAATKKWGKDIKRIYCINPDFAYGHDMHDECVRYWEKNLPHAKIVGEAWPPFGLTDFTSYITAILAAKPDLIQSTLYGGDATIFIKQAAAYGLLQMAKFLNPDLGLMAFLQPLRREDRAAPIGAVASSGYPFYIFNDPANVEFYTYVYKKSGWYPHAMSITPPYYVDLLKYAMEKAGTTTDLEKIIDVLDEDVILRSLVGPMHHRGCDHTSMDPIWVGVLQWDSEGKWPFPILGDLIEMRNFDELFHSCEEIRQIRLKAGNTYWYKK